MDSSSRYQANSGLLRFRSAPSPVLANFKQAENDGNPWEALRFFNSEDSNHTTLPTLREFVDNKASNNNTSNNKEVKESPSSSSLSRMNSQQGGYSTCSSTMLPSRYPSHESSVTVPSAMNMIVSSMGMDQSPSKSFHSNLLRQSSVPAAHFSNNVSFHNGYDTMKGVGNYGGVNDGNDGELSLSMKSMKNQINFSSRSPSSLGILSPTSKMGTEGVRVTEDGGQGGSNGDARYYSPGFPYASWNETPHHKRQRNSNDDELLSDAQNGEIGNQVHTLSHHLSLPRTSSMMFAMDNLLQFTDSVPCKIRAKRGFATHPRSIAERVRRTRISERIRKLQELVPNMEKQTSTAEMLDLAVDYIKNLQKQFKNLSDRRAKCKCIDMHKSETNQIA